MKVGEAGELMGADVSSLRAELFDKQITDFSIDSRSVGAGELFFALSQKDYVRAGFNGEFADGHTFIRGAFERGAIVAVARKDRVDGDAELEAIRSRLLLVDDAIAALQLLAHRVYLAWGCPVVGITGSAGKTTAKELTAHGLQRFGCDGAKRERQPVLLRDQAKCLGCNRFCSDAACNAVQLSELQEPQNCLRVVGAINIDATVGVCIQQ